MAESKSDITVVLARYPNCAPQAWRKASPGFSGAEVFRLETARGTFALRCWPPEHPSPERLTWIHTVLTHAVANGFDRLPLPIRTLDGRSFVRREGRLWELAPWLPGEADNRQPPSPSRVVAAMRALAELHQALTSFQPNPRPHGPSPGLIARLEQLRGLLAGGAAEIRAKIGPDPSFAPLPSRTSASAVKWVRGVAQPPELGASDALIDAGREILSHFARRAADVENQLATHVTRHVPLQPALRDIHREHVLFVGDNVTGMIDFGAMRFETVAGDIARLLGSFAQNDAAGWQAGLAAYETVRPLSTSERELVPVFDSSGVLVGGMNWLEWLFVERRRFTDLDLVQARLAELLCRLRAPA